MGVVDLVTNTVCIERAVCFIGVWEHSVMCWFYPQKGIKKKKKILLQHIFGMTHTHTSHRGLQSHTVFHTLTWPGRDCDCLMVSLHLNTALDDSEWCTQITASLVIYLFVFLLCLSFFFFFSFKCTCMALGRSGALLISINILFKNKRSTVYNTFHNHTWFLHKNVAKHRFPVYHGHPLLQVQISHLPASCPQRALGGLQPARRCHSLCQAAVWGELE